MEEACQLCKNITTKCLVKTVEQRKDQVCPIIWQTNISTKSDKNLERPKLKSICRTLANLKRIVELLRDSVFRSTIFSVTTYLLYCFFVLIFQNIAVNNYNCINLSWYKHSAPKCSVLRQLFRSQNIVQYEAFLLSEHLQQHHAALKIHNSIKTCCHSEAKTTLCQMYMSCRTKRGQSLFICWCHYHWKVINLSN